ncbi:MAG: NUDIX domain-containing protein [Pseudomonadota bacterium]
MSAPITAGRLAYRRRPAGPEFLLVHPGGPFWARKDQAAWSIPKGLVEPGEGIAAAAVREVAEELGQPIEGPALALTPCRLPGGKLLHAWLVEADLALDDLRSNSFELEWPRGSGRLQRFPEVDKAAYFDAATALWKIHRGQQPVLREAIARLGGPGPGGP